MCNVDLCFIEGRKQYWLLVCWVFFLAFFCLFLFPFDSEVNYCNKVSWIFREVSPLSPPNRRQEEIPPPTKWPHQYDQTKDYLYFRYGTCWNLVECLYCWNTYTSPWFVYISASERRADRVGVLGQPTGPTTPARRGAETYRSVNKPWAGVCVLARF